MPVLASQRRRAVNPTGWVALALVLGIGGYWWWRSSATPTPTTTSPTAPAPPAPLKPPTASPAPGAVADGNNGDGSVSGQSPTPVTRRTSSDSEEELHRAGLARVHVEVEGALETAVVKAAGESDGRRLVQVLVRALVWWLNVPGDLRRGDQLDALYETRPGEDPVIHALRYTSGKANRTFRAYLTKPASSRWPHLYGPDGSELELRLESPPLDDYQQVTSLLKDGRGHKGVDWKTPVGTPVKTPFDAVVVRKNWGWKQNGNCLELKQTSAPGRTVILLHLDAPPSVAVGAHVARGEVVAQSGNTGHSFAPHLHYQLQAGETVLDPFVAQPTVRRKLTDSERAELALEVARLDHLLDLP